MNLIAETDAVTCGVASINVFASEYAPGTKPSSAQRMSHRKPVPRAVSVSSDSETSSSHSSADRKVKRYTLTDRPVSLSLDQDPPLLSSDRTSISNDTMNETPLSATMRSAAAAYYDRERREYRRQQEEHPQTTREYRPYQPGQYLAPIITGETLQLDDIVGAHSQESTEDSFHDPTTPIAKPLQLQYDLSTQPDTTFHHQPPYDQQQELHQPPPSSDHHSQSGSEYYGSQASSTTHGYTPVGGAESMLVGSEIDHFQHDAEAAYSSGTAYSTSPYRPPRSRSPTPAVDDEDYYIVGNESVHYTGAFGDPEKVLLQEQFINYPIHGEYLAPGHPQHHSIIYDPEPPTPTSNHTSLPETPLDTQHFGPAPSGRVIRRHKTKKRVPLTNGNLVVNLDVPPRLVLPRRMPEMMQTRYTAVTCDPDEFEKNGFFLRQNERGRRTELLIMITMYNVSDVPHSFELDFELTNGCFVVVVGHRKMRCYFVGRCMAL
jgi:chitin synthase